MEYKKQLMQKLVEKLDYACLYNTVLSLNWPDHQPLPAPPADGSAISEDPNWMENEEFLMTVHDLCCKRHITEGALICPACSREYQIKMGIANMLLTEEEV